MIERLISFASQGGAYGAVALGPAGDDGSAAAGFVEDAGGSVELSDANAERGEGTLRVSGAGGELILGLAAQTSLLAFETGEGQELGVQAVGASAELHTEGSPPRGFEATGVAWQIRGEEDATALRTTWAALGDGSLLVLFALRPPGAEGHGTETVGAARIAKDGAVTSFAEPLLSTEYDGDGAHTRATLELWGEDDGALATRGGGRRGRGGRSLLGGLTLEAARFEWRLSGVDGFGGYEIVSR